jgi:hypothetical protein
MVKILELSTKKVDIKFLKVEYYMSLALVNSISLTVILKIVLFETR